MSAPELFWLSGETRMEALESGYIKTERGIQIRLFSINRSIYPGLEPFVLRSTLPGYTKERYVDSIAEAKGIANGILVRFRQILNGPEDDLDEAIERAVDY